MRTKTGFVLWPLCLVDPCCWVPAVVGRWKSGMSTTSLLLGILRGTTAPSMPSVPIQSTYSQHPGECVGLESSLPHKNFSTLPTPFHPRELTAQGNKVSLGWLQVLLEGRAIEDCFYYCSACWALSGSELWDVPPQWVLPFSDPPASFCGGLLFRGSFFVSSDTLDFSFPFFVYAVKYKGDSWKWPYHIARHYDWVGGYLRCLPWDAKWLILVITSWEWR